MFNLEQAIAEWRRQMRAAGIKGPAVLDELESHLRETVEQQMRGGATAEQAFTEAVRRVGSAEELKLEFGKVERLQPAVNPQLISFGCAGMGAFIVLTGMWLLSGAPIAEQVLGFVWLAIVGAYVVALPYLNRRLGPGVRGWALRKAIAAACNFLLMAWVAVLLLDCANILHFALGTRILPNVIVWPLAAAAMATVLTLAHGTDTRSLGFWTPAAQQCLAIAREEAERFHHDFIGTEHVLLGLLEANDSAVSSVLEKMGVRREAVRAEIEKIVATGPQLPAGRAPVYTPRAQKAFCLAMKEAKSSHTAHVDPPHVLLGLLREGSGVAARVLQKLGVDLKRVREEVLKHAR